MDKSWADIIGELQSGGMTYAQIGEAIGSAGSTVGDLASGRSQSPRAASALALLRLHSARCARPPVEVVPPHADSSAVDIDLRMSKRALRARLGLSTDKQLAKVLQLPAEQVEGWEEERTLPAVPEVLRLLGAQASAAPAPQEPEDPDVARIVPVETA
ncbi:hypothetical protein [Stenotrophomonas acidaminiphila]|uniref:hypothetical protein n=1 Tax=Stenotrophomonas acidaminiphila TaxID=128780 RepID=UPI0028AC6A52|nr:hypothetical protein [Stenotrophomonas acidaminiphila]